MGPYDLSLDPKRKEIRRLVLQPLSAGASIQCLVEVVSLSDEPEFEALSYVWGDASIKSNIILEGAAFPVTKNLATALFYLRFDDNPRRLWVDALCINQGNTKERNEQVAIMGEIYAHANPVLIWLGEASEGSNRRFNLMPTIADGTEVADEILENMFTFYMELVEREWFNRLWTVQELVLADNDPMIGCGIMWTKWSILFGAWHRVAEYVLGKIGMVSKCRDEDERGKDGSSDVQRPVSIKIDVLNQLHEKVRRDGGEDLRKLLFITKTSKATEPRDIIYALLGMLPKDDRDCFTIDYDLPLEKVFAEAIKNILQKGTGLLFLSGMEMAGPLSTSPSWVPKFGAKFLFRPTLFHPPGIGASGVDSDCINGSIDQDLNVMHVRGLPIDEVVDRVLFGDLEECLGKLPQVEEMRGRANQLAAIHSSHRPYLNKLKAKEALWRTLIANKAYSGRARDVAPDAYREMYNMLLNEQKSGQVSDKEITRDYRLRLLNHLPSSCFFITATGFYGIGQSMVEKGDQLSIWFGSPVPFVLRPRNQYAEQGKQVHSVVGVAYVAGIMDGEMVDEVYCEDLEDDVEFVVR